MKSIADMSMAELVAFVQSALRQEGIDTTLSGGSCVTYWSGNAYLSDDLDLIADGFDKRRQIRAIMGRLGFREERRYFVNADTKWFIEFPSGPLTVGEEKPSTILSVTLATGVMRLLSPTDCVKDRLAAWHYYSDNRNLQQALAVSSAQQVDVAEIRRWAEGERRAPQVSEFLKMVMSSSKDPRRYERG